MNIREVTFTDLDAILDIFNSLDAVGRSWISWTSISIAGELQYHQSKGLGLWDSGSLCSFILVRELPVAWEILFLMTAPVREGHGCMTNLMAELQRRSCEANKSLWLEVHSSNKRAQSLYLNLGFIENGRRARYYPDGGDAILMEFTRGLPKNKNEDSC